MTASNYSSASRERMLIFGFWLIGIGSVLMVRELVGWEWRQAWPLFVTLVGAGGTFTAVVNRRRTRVGVWGIWWPLALLVIGVLLLASTTGWVDIALPQLVGWWPVAVIGLGIWFLIGALLARENKVQKETLALPLGGLSQAEVRLNFGGGELVVGPAQPGMLVSGQFEGGVIQRENGYGRIELRPFDPGVPFFGGRALHWQVGITSEIPVDVRLESGANRSTIDLSALRVRRLEVHTGASETRIRLPASGATSVRAETGLASLNIEVPAGVSARIRSKIALGATKVDETRFPRSLDGWASPDYETATNRVDLDIQGGLGSVRIS